MIGRRDSCPKCGNSVQVPGPEDNLSALPTPGVLAAEPRPSVKSTESTRSSPPDIGGWLILPALGRIITPLFVLGFAYMLHVRTLGSQHVKPPELPAQDQSPGFLIPLAYGWALVHVVASIFFFCKKRFVPKMMIGLYTMDTICSLVLMGSAYQLASARGATSSIEDSNGPSFFMFSVALCVIWSFYFLLSKRVKATFVR